MSIPQINNVDVPISMRSRAMGYTFQAQEMGLRNGKGIPAPAGPQYVVWVFNRMTYDEIAWWDGFLNGAKAVEITQAKLWDDRFQLQTFTSGTLYRPAAETHRAAAFWTVTIEINHLLPIVS